MNIEPLDRNFSFEQHSSTLVDKFAAKVRYNKIDSILDSLDINLINKNICDVGCGYNCNFLMHLKKKYSVENLFGVDININPELKKYVNFTKTDLENADFDLPENSIDIITSLAVIEHLTNPTKYLNEIHRVLINGGYLILTTPTKFSKPFLFFLAYTGIGTKEEILDHKLYYSKMLLYQNLQEKFTNIKLKYFSLGINMYVICKKK
jgi:SAM-dependent methyltransferase